jgi:tripeptidyl-peptidase-2
METGTALARACTYIMQRQSSPDLQKIDVINMSYGEHSHWSNTGRIGDLMHEVIYHPICWFVILC